MTVIFLSLALCMCVRRNRKLAEEAAKDCSVEESQMQGPPTVLRATYNPNSGHSIYAIGTPGTGTPIPVTAVTPPTATTVETAATPAYPTPAIPPPSYTEHRRSASGSTSTQPKTAPSHKSSFSEGSHPYPFTGMGNQSVGSARGVPKTALPSNGGFPRPLLSGRLKDRMRERPESVSSVRLDEGETSK